MRECIYADGRGSGGICLSLSCYLACRNASGMARGRLLERRLCWNLNFTVAELTILTHKYLSSAETRHGGDLIRKPNYLTLFPWAVFTGLIQLLQGPGSFNWIVVLLGGMCMITLGVLEWVGLFVFPAYHWHTLFCPGDIDSCLCTDLLASSVPMYCKIKSQESI